MLSSTQKAACDISRQDHADSLAAREGVRRSLCAVYMSCSAEASRRTAV